MSANPINLLKITFTGPGSEPLDQAKNGESQ